MTGSIVTFDDAIPFMPIEKLIATIEPQQDGSGDPSPENVRSITGWTGLSGKRCGKNLANFINGKGVDTSGNVTDATTRIATVDAIKIDNTQSYCLSFVEDTDFRALYCVYSNGSMVRRTTGVRSGTILNVQGGDSVRICIYNNVDSSRATVENQKPMLEQSSTASTYEAYTSLPITVSWQDTAGTVYGGMLDVVSGLLTVDWKIVDLATLTWTTTSWGGWRTGSISDLKIIPSTENANLVAEKYKSVSQGDLQQTPNGIATGITTTPQRLYVNATDSPTGMCVYPLAEPIVYQLSGQQISTLLGNNTVFVDTGDVSVTYQSTSGSTPVRTSFKSPLKSYSYSALKLFGNTFIEHGKG